MISKAEKLDALDQSLEDQLAYRNACRDRVGEHANEPGPGGAGGRSPEDVRIFLGDPEFKVPVDEDPGEEPEPEAQEDSGGEEEPPAEDPAP